MKPDKKSCIAAVFDRIEGFCRARLNDEYEVFAKGLLARIVYLPRMNLMRGRPEIWAAAIVTVIARLNFLFDKANPDATTMDEICAFFGTVRSTTGNKAAAIEKACDIRMGEPGLCREEITETLTFYEAGDGPLAAPSMRKRRGGTPSNEKSLGKSRHRPKPLDGQEESRGKKMESYPKKPAHPKKKKNTGDERQLRLFDDF